MLYLKGALDNEENTFWNEPSHFLDYCCICSIRRYNVRLYYKVYSCCLIPTLKRNVHYCLITCYLHLQEGRIAQVELVLSAYLDFTNWYILYSVRLVCFLTFFLDTM